MIRAARSHASQLLPLSLGDLFDETFDLYKRNFALFAGIVAALHVPAHILLSSASYALGIERLMQEPVAPGNEIGAALGVLAFLMVWGILYTALFVVVSGALTVAISDRYLGAPVTVGSAYRRMLRHGATLAGTWILLFCVLIPIYLTIAFVWLLVLGVALTALGAAGSLNNEETAVVMTLLFMAVSFVLTGAVMLFALQILGLFGTQIAVIEGCSPLQAIQRNWNLVQGRVFPIYAAMLLLALLLGGLSLSLHQSVVWTLELLVFPTLQVSLLAQRLLMEVASALISLFLQPFWMICLTLLYYDQRVRREGFDLDILAQQLQASSNREASR
jgi:hypothetical protein